jgi:O-methyltransferase/methyltransferase family protein
MREIMVAYFTSRALWAAAELNVAGSLATGPMPVSELARRTKADETALYRVLRALASLGIFAEDDEGRFRNTELSELLLEGRPDSLRDLVLLFGHETAWQSWGALLHTVRTGETGFDHVYGQKFFDYLAEQPPVAELFDRAMASASSTTNAAMVEAYDFSTVGAVVDVAGGVGSALCAMLEAAPDLRGIVFDLPRVKARAEEFIARAGFSARCRFVAGSFFESLPAGADLYFLKHILHDWNDDSCNRILKTCVLACKPRGRILICERIVPPGNALSPAKWIDLHMMLTTHGGRERTEREFRTLLERAGFRITRIVPTRSIWSLIEAVPA